MEEDQLELAECLAEDHRNLGIEKSRMAMARQMDPSFNGVDCIECDNEIPPQRLAMHRIRCTACETAAEQKAKRYRH